jgi:hypothetical protein
MQGWFTNGTGGSDGGCFEIFLSNYEPGFPSAIWLLTPGDAGSNSLPTSVGNTETGAVINLRLFCD